MIGIQHLSTCHSSDVVFGWIVLTLDYSTWICELSIPDLLCFPISLHSSSSSPVHISSRSLSSLPECVGATDPDMSERNVSDVEHACLRRLQIAIATAQPCGTKLPCSVVPSFPYLRLFFFLHNAVRSDNRIFWKDMRSSDLCDCVRLFKWDLWLQQWKLMKLVLSVRDAVTLIRMKLHYEENPLPPRLALSSSLSLTHTLTLTHTKSYMSVHHV